MPRCRILMALLTFAIVSGGWLMGDDPKKPADLKSEPPKATTHTLPSGWKALGLTDEQKKKIYTIEDEYNPKIDALKKQIEALQAEERSKKYSVLTDEQKKHFKEIRESKDGGTEKKDDKKDEKKDDKKGDKKEEKKDEKKS